MRKKDKSGVLILDLKKRFPEEASAFLERNRYRVILCSSIKAAAEELKKHRPVAIIFNTSENRTVSPEVVRSVHLLADEFSVPVIVVVPTLGLRGKKNSLSLLGDDFLTGIPTGPELLVRIEKLLQIGRQTDRVEEKEWAVGGKHFQTFLDAASDMVFLKDDKLRYVFANPRLLMFYGMPEDEVIGRKDDELGQHCLSKTGLLPSRETEVLQTGQMKVFEGEIEDRSYEFRLFPMLFAEGRSGVGGYIRDLTSSKGKEKEAAFNISFPQLNPIPIVEVSPAGKIVYTNPVAAKLFTGEKKKDFKGQYLGGVEEAAQRLQRGQEESEEREVDIAGRRFKQYIRYISQTGNVRIYGEEITERKKAEEALEKSKARFSRYMEHASDLVMVIRNNLLHWVAPSVERLLGYKPEEMVGKERLMPIHPGDHEAVRKKAEEAYNQPGISVPAIDIRFRHKDGSWHFFECIGTVFQENGDEPYLVVNGRDVTERRAAEETLKTTSLRLQSAMDMAHIAYWELDVDKAEFIYNNAYYVLYGTTAEAQGGYHIPITEHLDRFVHPDDIEMVKNATARIEIDKEPFSVNQIEHRIIRGDGEVRYILSRSEVYRDNTGKIIKATGTNQDITDLKRTEEELKTTSLRLQNAMDLARLVYWDLDSENGDFVFNDGFYALYGTTADAQGGYRIPAGEYFHRFVHPDDLPIIEAQIERIETAKEPVSHYQTEHRMVRADGEVRYILSRSQVYRDDTGKVLKTTGVNQDITERKAAEEALKRSEAHFRSYVENSSDFFMVIRDKKILYASPSVKRLLGYEPEEIIGTDGLQFLDPDDFKAVMEKYIWAFDNPGLPNVPFNVRYRHKNGSWRIFESIGTVFTDPSGEAYLVSNNRDITERKEAEEAIKRSEARFRSYVEYSSDFFMVIGDRILQYVSPSVERLLGYKQDEVIGTDGIWLIHPDDLTFVLNKFGETMDHPGIPNPPIEVRYRHKDGAWRVFEAVGTAYPDVSGEMYVVINNHDITERKNIEDALRTSALHLQDAADLARIVYWEIDPETNEMICDDAFFAFYGTTAAEEGGYRLDHEEYVRRFIHHDDVEKLYRFAIKIMNTPGLFYTTQVECRIVRRDGGIRNILGRVRVFRDSSNKILRVFGAHQDITERKEAEEALRKNEERYRLLAENARDMIMLINPDTLLPVYVTPSVERVLGFTREELYRRAPEDSIPPESAAVVRRALENIVREMREGIVPEPFHSEIEHYRKDGSIAWLDAIFSPGGDISGPSKVIQAILRDVTDRKLAEEELRKSEELFHNYLEYSSDLLFVIDEEGIINYVGPSIERILGYKPEEMVGKAGLNYIDPGYHAIIAKAVVERRKNLGTADRKPIEVRYLHKDGSWRDVEAVGTSFRDENGRYYLVSNGRDITERKKMERDLVESEKRYRLIAQYSTDLVWVIDPATNYYTYASPSIENILGYSVEEALKLDPEKCVTPESFVICRKHVAGVLQSIERGETPEKEVYEIEHIRKDGRTVWMESIAVPVFDGEGKLIAIQGASRDITERKRMENALRESEERYRLIAENVTDIIFLLDPDTLIPIYVSPSVQKVLGYTPQEFYQSPPEDKVSSDSAKMVRSCLENAVREARADRPAEGRFEVENLHKDGSPVWLEAIFGMVYDDAGKLVAVQVSNRDITERKRVEAALRASEERYRLIAENSNDVISLIDPDTLKPFYASPSFERLYGYTLKEAGEKVFKPEFLKIIRDSLGEIVKETRAGNPIKRERLEVERFHKDGSVIWTESNLSTVIDETGKLVAIQSVDRDITERKRVEAALRASEERYRLIAENANDIIFLIDPETLMPFYVSPSAEKVLGFSPQEMCESPPEKMLKPESAKEVRRFLEKVVQDAIAGNYNEGGRFEIEQRKKDGSFIWLDVSFNSILDDSGKVAAIQCVDRDISDRKKAEKDLARRTEELARSNEELEHFAYVASHDLQEPLRMVASYTGLLARRYKGKLDSDADEFIEFAIDGATRMKQLIEDLLLYSRVGTRGKAFAPVDTQALLNNVLLDLKVAIEDAGATVVSDHLPVVSADWVQIGQVFQNLINNAIKFRSADPPLIKVSAKAEENHWVFSVEDNGIGIDPQFAQRIFVIFQRLHTRDKYPGTGIGLAVCKRIIERHKGRIWLESTPGKGTVFYFTLPMKGEKRT